MSERDGPLLVLARRLLSLGPPSLSTLIARVAEAEEYEDFVSLVREFLPEREPDILREATPARQIAAFASHFRDRYFPLQDYLEMGDAESYGDLTRDIPVIPLGLSDQDYHAIVSDWRSGFQLMTYLVESPCAGEARLPLAEACQEYIPVSLMEQVPEHGFSPGELRYLLGNTEHRALAHWADIVWHDTGNFFLDTDDANLWSDELPNWDDGTVANLTREWQQAEAMQEEIDNLVAWLEEDPPAHFRELLEFTHGRQENE
ncbi:MAG: hypothetical protein HY670_10555 [Chloroflexi bacterium]|nr:hypothetical protein [Chloroflexota bacterium]